MGRKALPLGGILSVLAMFSAPALALPFAPIEPVSYALGGTGVSSASNTYAGYLNPALLAINEGQKADLPPTAVLGYRYFDRQNVMDTLISYKDSGAVQAYDTELARFKNEIYIDNDPAKSRALIAEKAIEIRNHLNGHEVDLRFRGLADKPVQQEYMAAIVVAIPHDKFNMSFSLSRKMLGGAIIEITDSDLNELERVADAAGEDSLLSDEPFDSSQFTSRFNGRGLNSTEFGLSIAQNYTLGGHDIAVGITPKFILATSFDYAEHVHTADFETDLGTKNNSAFDVDVGAVKSYGNGWSAGVAIKNLIGQKYKTRLGNEIRIKPQARIGVSHAMKWAAVAIDMDLNKSESLGLESQTQYLGIGAELNVFDMSTVRIGYRSNLSDETTSVATVGFGIKVYGVQVDLAVGANEDEIDVAASAGYQF